MKKMWMAAMLLILMGSVGISLLLRLTLTGWLMVFLVSVGLLPLFWQNHRREQEGWRKYEEVSVYMEQLICSYRRWGTLGKAWEDCVLLFDENSEIRQSLELAIDRLKTGEHAIDNDIIGSACAVINEKYESCRLILLHAFLCRAEQMGGDTGDALDILLHDLQLWKRRTSSFLTQKKIWKAESIISALLAGGLCCFSRVIMPFDLENRLVSSVWYQISSVVVLCLLMITLLMIFRKLTGEWLDPGERSSFLQREQKKQYALLKSEHHGVKWLVARRYCRQQVEKEYPYWLLSVTLYLQQDTVYQALCNSLQQFSGMLGLEVKKLIDGIYAAPSSLLPYMDFFKELEMEEIQSGMKILYSAGSSEYRDVERQVHFLVEQNNLTMDKFEQHKQELRTAGMGVLKQIPFVFAAGKAVIDMAALLMMWMGG